MNETYDGDSDGEELSEDINGEENIQEFIDDIGSSRKPSAEVMQFIVDGFKEILAGEDPRRALKLTKKRGNFSDYHFEKYLDWAVAVELARRHVDNYSKAIEVVALVYRVSERNIKRRHNEHKGQARDLVEDAELRYIFKDHPVNIYFNQS